MSEKLAIHHLDKTFNIGSNSENHVIRDLSLTIEDGDFISVIGSNGAGKSTLMNLIAGSLAPDNGEIILNGEAIHQLPAHKRAQQISRVFQDPKAGTARNLMIEENLAIAARRGHGAGFSRGVSQKQRETFKSALRTLDMGLEDRLDTPAEMLSGGQRQALTLLMATIQTPEILLLDEHTAALDPRISKQIMAVTEKLVSENHVTTLMITHNMNDAIACGNRLIMLHQGHIAIDISGEDKRKLTVDRLMQLFQESVGETLVDDELLLQH